MRACLLCLLVLISGCSTLNGPRATNATSEPSDEALAKALAHYARGLLYEADQGRQSPLAAAEFNLAATYDLRYRTASKAAISALVGNNTQRAVTLLEGVCLVEPRNSQALSDLASIYQMDGKFEKAASTYARAVEVSPTNVFAQIELVQMLFRLKKNSQAVDALRNAASINTSNTAILSCCYDRGHEYLEQGDMITSAACFDILIAGTRQRGSTIHKIIGEVYGEYGHDRLSEKHLTIATESADPDPDAFLKLAVLQARSDTAKALRTLQEGLKLAPDNVTIRAMLARIYGIEKQYDKALTELTAIEKTAQERKEQLSLPYYTLYGGICEQAGQYKKAESVFEECLKLYPKAHSALNYLAYMWAERGEKLDKALEYVRKAMELDPDNGAYTDTLGWIYFKQKDYARALAEIRTACELTENDPVVLEHLGDVFEAMSDRKLAVETWRKSFLTDPESKTVAEKLQASGVDMERLRKEAELLRKQAQEAKDKPAGQPPPAKTSTPAAR